MASLAPLHDHADQRNDPVRPLFGRPGTMRVADGDAIEVMIADLTREGCRIVSDAVVAPDTACRIGIANVGLTPARLVWQGAGGYGCAFDVPLPPGAVTAAFGGSNVAVLPTDWWRSTPSRSAAKLAPPARALVLGALVLGSWGMVIGAVALAF